MKKRAFKICTLVLFLAAPLGAASRRISGQGLSREDTSVINLNFQDLDSQLLKKAERVSRNDSITENGVTASTITASSGTITALSVSTITASSAVFVGTTSFALSGRVFAFGGRSFFEANSEELSIGLRFSGANGSSGNFYIGASNSSTPDMVLSNNGGTAILRVRNAGGISVLSDMASGSPVANTLYKSTVVKGWIRMDGTGTISITDSFNVSGITDNAVGNYTVTWDTDFANANYAVTATASTQGGFNVACANNYAVGSVQVRTTRVSTEVDTDVAQLSVIAIGDQ